MTVLFKARGLVGFTWLRLITATVAVTFLFVGSTAQAAVPNDPQYMRLKPWGNIALERAWDITRGDREIIVAVLDTGVDVDHPDLAANIWTNDAEIPNDGVDNDNNGFVDDYYGWDFVFEDNDPGPDTTGDFNEVALNHGTIVAGLIGAVGNNNTAGTGVSWKVRIMPLRILDSTGVGDTLMALRAVEYATAQGADIINMSLVGNAAAGDLQTALTNAYNAGVTIVAAAGNALENELPKDLDFEPYYPVCYRHPVIKYDMIIGVAAVDENDALSDFSNYGSACVDVSAPGEFLPSTLVESLSDGFTQTYGGQWSGTSVAAPLVSGTAALIKSIDPTFTPEQITGFIKQSTDDISDKNKLKALDMGTGRLNVEAALLLAQQNISTDEPDVVQEPEGTDEPEVSPPTIELIATPTPSAFGWDIIVGPQYGRSATIKLFDSQGDLQTVFSAFEDDFIGGVTLAGGDVDGDGESEIVVGKGVGSTPEVRIFSKTGQLEQSFFVGELDDTRGVRVSVIDVGKDGKFEIGAVPLSGDSEFIKIFTHEGKRFSKFSPGQRQYPFGMYMGSGLVNGRPRVIVSEQKGDDQFIEAWSADGAFANHWIITDMKSARPRLALDDVDNNGVADIVLGASPGTRPYIATRPFDNTQTQNLFLAWDAGFRGGINVAAARGAIVAGPGKGAQSFVRVFSLSGQLLSEFRAFDRFYRGGLQVGILP